MTRRLPDDDFSEEIPVDRIKQLGFPLDQLECLRMGRNLEVNVSTGGDCPQCEQKTMATLYRVIDGGACDTSEWHHFCTCGHYDTKSAPNTSDYAY